MSVSLKDIASEGVEEYVLLKGVAPREVPERVCLA
jgi:hypothetical protein